MFILKMIEKELKRIDWLIANATSHLQELQFIPSKKLSCIHHSGSNIYYYESKTTNGVRKRNSLGKVGNERVKQYKKHRFYTDQLSALQFDKKLLSEIVKKYKDYSPLAIHKKLPLSYKNLPDECYADEQFDELKAWAAEKYERNSFPLPTDPTTARDGTPLRSKGEAIVYDNILFEKLPVRVDPKLNLKGKSGAIYTLCPDFQFKCKDGSYIILEHLGNLGDDKYAHDNMMKIQKYLDCGFVIGVNLFFTSDNAEGHTDETAIIDTLETIKKRMFR